jgi:hypothetical protein
MIRTEIKLIVDKDDDYLEFGNGDLIDICLKDGTTVVATILDIQNDKLFVSDDESDDGKTLTISFTDIEDIFEG